MGKVDCSTEMDRYHKDEVALQKADQEVMRTRRNAGRARLNAGLERDGYAVPTETASQGSYAMRTMVQDSESNYDIDDGAYFKKDDLKDANGTALTPYQARLRVCNALIQDDRLKHPAEVHKNCVRQEYPEGYHVDIPVYKILTSDDTEGDSHTQYQLASKDDWVTSDARGVTKWFENIVGTLNAGEIDGSQLRRVVRLTKKFARSRTQWKKVTPSGICLTKLVVECFVAHSGRDDSSLHETWKGISVRLAKSYKIDHPVLPGTALTEEGDAKVAFFRLCLTEALLGLKVLDEPSTSKEKALDAWDKTFNTTFFSEQHDEKKESKPAGLLGSLLGTPGKGSDLSFPNKPVIPNKPAGFA